MHPDFHFYEPAKGHGLAHDPFNAIVGPRPIGWISTHDGAGHFNLAPYSFFNAFAYRPPVIGFASSGEKDTLRNVRATGEFVWNLATRALAAQMNATSGSVAREVSEFEVAGLTPVAAEKVGAPRVGESPVSFECRVTQVVQLTDHRQSPMPNWVVFGEVVAVHIARWLLVDGVYDTAAARPILRAGGTDAYVEVTPQSVFRMKRPA
ncbi:MAG: flavin reductase family protein [Pseudomonadota bacterium]|jgi:flavin reductase (DIM6/NTAB) family NADH-FMN oxidoreductase RutF|nr:MAG: Asp/Glu/hydantoin racemase [Pseudomonadota bacterium]